MVASHTRQRKQKKRATPTGVIMPKIHELLGTKNRKDQEQRVQQLLNSVNNPVVDVIVRFDPRYQEPIIVEVIGGTITFVQAQRILDGAKEVLRMREVKASIDQQGMPPDELPQHPDQPAEDSAEPSQESSALVASAE